MNRITALMVLTVVSCTAYAQTKVDSIVYDKATEWKLFRGDGGPATHFTLQGATLWQSNADKVSSLNVNAQPKNNGYKSYPTLGTLPASGVTAMATDSNGAVWFGTGSGLAMLKGAAFTVFTKENGLPSNAVTCIFPVSDGRVWVGTAEGLGLYKGGAWTAYTKAQGLRGDQIRCMTLDQRGALWVGTNMGISILLDGKWTSQSMDNGMSWNDTKALAFDGRGKKMWAAVGEQDVNSYDGKSWQVYMGIQDGILCIMADTQSRIWFGSSAGLLKFNGEEWINDPAKLGVPAKLVSQMYRDAGGNLWFGSENGVIFLKNPYPF